MADINPGSGQKVSDVAASMIRTIVPVIVGTAVTWLAEHTRIVIQPSWSDTAVLWTNMAIIAGYYSLGRFLERIKGNGFWRRAGRGTGRWMLGGVIRQPVYSKPPTDQAVVIEPGGAHRRPV